MIRVTASQRPLNRWVVELACLYKWKEKIQAQRSDSTLDDDERSELKRLRSEVKTLCMEKIFLETSVDSIGQCNTCHKISVCRKLLNLHVRSSLRK